ncbi:MAG: amino acid racemase [Ornithinimicrobium sp.]
MAENEIGAPSRLVGILGGMGPAATADFYTKLVRHTPATIDQDHLRVVMWADPTVPSRQDALLAGGTDPTPWLVEGVGRLIAAGADIVVVPCNTIHAYLGPVMADQPVDFISIIDTTVQAVQRRGVKRIGLLATDGALASEVFQSAFDAAGIEWELPSTAQQAHVMRLVHAVKAGGVDDRARADVEALLSDLQERGASTMVAGCTEISALLAQLSLDDSTDLVDPALELARRTIERATSPASR